MGTTNPSIEEIYFLVRVGSWGQTELEAHIDQLVSAALEDQAFDLTQDSNSAYEQGWESGRHQGWEEGKEQGYDSGYSRGHSDGYSEGISDGESRSRSSSDRW